MSGPVEVLGALRTFMTREGLSALVVPSEDAHQSEYVPLKDRRREFVSGFTGSAGTAVITMDKALLWTDGRYFLQAANELTGEWELMKALEKDVPTVEEWLSKHLPEKSSVGINGLLLSVGQSRLWQKQLEPRSIGIKALPADPVDGIWADQPPAPDAAVRVHPVEYAGKSVEEKLVAVREKVKAKGAQALLVTALDEIAWLYNIRGNDVEYNPVVISYSVLTESSAVLFIDTTKLGPEVMSHLSSSGVAVKPYEDIHSYLSNSLIPDLGSKGKVLLDATKCSLALYSLIPPESIVEEPSPITLAKAIKNEKELEGMRQAHIRDGAALVAFLAWLQHELAHQHLHKRELTEASIADKLEQFRAAQDKYVSLSFATISACGPNGSIIHYKPSDTGSAPVTRDAIVLIDSGGQYLDGTTDVTRTVHFGTPTPEEKTSFTLVLKGHINLASVRFPEGSMGSKLDILARLPLWDFGLDYKHGTGHGVGAFLNVHEGPQSISYKKRPYEEGLMPGMVTSNEPGFYADGRYGIRIESLVICNVAATPHQFGDVKYCEFETITMAPIQTSLIDRSLLTASDIKWINSYHATVREKLSPLLVHDPLGYDYLIRETEPI